ncbi:MAG: 1,4-dihydroxy-2-naphthoate octaprenyltransferase [Verrucomicrobiae bacterium]|nr:1,4-dihydroxy-2-naphthoate octaprenyltransferase [Verrucomicrobiae bacterium]NNJ43353.1 1,4-dihydroxy-2-naphthoate octaprenyltransferase [Akkermansiaceae bacterium]
MKSFILAARPKTLPAAIVPVWVGCALAFHLTGMWDGALAFYTLMGAVWIQLATNFFNDAIDADKGADTAARIGPVRATASGRLSRATVYVTACVCLLVAAVFGYFLYAARGWPMLVMGLPSFYFAYGYTGGPLPLAYKGLGELFVILFFGWVAVTGTVFVQTGHWFSEAMVAGLATGCLSAVLISINNLRDVDEDRLHGKNTLAVKWGRARSLNLLLVMTAVAYVCGVVLFPLGAGLLYFLPALILGAVILRQVSQTLPSPVYNRYLAMAALQLILFAVAFTFNTCG